MSRPGNHYSYHSLYLSKIQKRKENNFILHVLIKNFLYRRFNSIKCSFNVCRNLSSIIFNSYSSTYLLVALLNYQILKPDTRTHHLKSDGSKFIPAPTTSHRIIKPNYRQTQLNKFQRIKTDPKKKRTNISLNLLNATTLSQLNNNVSRQISMQGVRS